MGRGRAKAKQTKVARELKYSSGGTDLEALRKELASGTTAPAGGADTSTRSTMSSKPTRTRTTSPTALPARGNSGPALT